MWVTTGNLLKAPFSKHPQRITGWRYELTIWNGSRVAEVWGHTGTPSLPERYVDLQTIAVDVGLWNLEMYLEYHGGIQRQPLNKQRKIKSWVEFSLFMNHFISSCNMISAEWRISTRPRLPSCLARLHLSQNSDPRTGTAKSTFPKHQQGCKWPSK